jgi:Family of unknown function (DUF6178)
MSTKKITRYTKNHNLSNQILSHPDLPALISHMPQSSLNGLIEKIGVEDSATLIANIPSEKIANLVSQAIWKNTPGKPEFVDFMEYYRWLETLLEAGGDIAVRSTMDQGKDFFSLLLDHFCYVDNLDSGRGHNHDIDAVLSFEEFRVAIPLDHAETISELLLKTWDYNSAHLCEVLQNCCHDEDDESYSSLNRDRHLLLIDFNYQREMNQESKGYVTPLNAVVFLRYAREQPLETLSEIDRYDANTKHYFSLSAEQLKPEASEFKNEASPSELSALVEQCIGNESQASTLRLGWDRSTQQNLILNEMMQLLESYSQEHYLRRLAELKYLSNILISGQTFKKSAFTDEQASLVTMALCNLGLHYLADQHRTSSDVKQQILNHLITDEPGLISVFQIAWHLTMKLPLLCAKQLEATFAMPISQKILNRDGWIKNEINKIVFQNKLSFSVEFELFNEMDEHLNFLCIGLETSAAQKLNRLIDDFPTLPAEGKDSHHYISTLDEIWSINGFLQKLPDNVCL